RRERAVGPEVAEHAGVVGAGYELGRIGGAGYGVESVPRTEVTACKGAVEIVQLRNRLRELLVVADRGRRNIDEICAVALRRVQMARPDGDERVSPYVLCRQSVRVRRGDQRRLAGVVINPIIRA